VTEPRIAYRVHEVAELLGVPVVRVQRWLATGKLHGFKIGNLWFVATDELEALVKGYDDQRARSRGGDAVPAEPGSSLGGDGDDAGRSPPVRVREVEGRRRAAAPGTHETAGRGDTPRSRKAAAWTVPPEVAR
jgi:excisionase family DNA binding protein